MVKKFFWWFVCFGASFLVADVFGWTDQGRAFLYIHLGVDAVLIVIGVLALLIAGIAVKAKLLTSGISILLILWEIASIAITLFATWGATKIFNIDFFVTYQIMTFGSCLVRSSSSESESKSNSNY